MSKLKCSLAAGLDGLPPLFFKKLAKSLAKPLSMLYDICFSNGHMPDIWKHALVTPVFKKGKSSLAENYRPISLTCVACKIFESVIKTRLMELFKENSTLNPSQHGFLKATQLVQTCSNASMIGQLTLKTEIILGLLILILQKHSTRSRIRNCSIN